MNDPGQPYVPVLPRLHELPQSAAVRWRVKGGDGEGVVYRGGEVVVPCRNCGRTGTATGTADCGTALLVSPGAVSSGCPEVVLRASA